MNFTELIDLAVDEQTHETFVAQADSERQFALGDVESGFGIAQSLVVQARHIFERCVAHGGVVTIDIECSHKKC